MSTLRTAAQQALEALEGWDNHGKWVWPESALEQAKRNTTEAITALRAALAEPNADYERGFVDGMSEQAKRSVDKAVNALVEEPTAYAKAIAQAYERGWDAAKATGDNLSPTEPVQEPDYWQKEARRYAGNADYWRKRYEALTEPCGDPAEYNAEPVQEPPCATWDDPRVQKVYDLLCDAAMPPNKQEHWEGWVARRIVDALAEPVQEPVVWTPVAEALPKSGVKVLACYCNRLGNLRRIRAQWVAAKTEEVCGDADDWGEYDEEAECYWTPQGWYECIDNWGDYSSVAVCEGEVTHWMPLPPAPDTVSPQRPAEPQEPTVCAYCRHPLYAGVKCRMCGGVTA